MRDGCAFCDYEGPSEILRDDGPTFVIMPLNPVTIGHVLVVPRQHVQDARADPATAGYTLAAAARWARDHESRDCNLVTSCGPAATQTVFHLHVHVVPRQVGDGLALPWSEADR